MLLLKVSLENQNVYVDLIDGEYRLRLYEDGLVFDRSYKNVKKLNRSIKELGLNFRISEDYKKCEFKLVCNEEHSATISFRYKEKIVYSSVKRKFSNNDEYINALELIIKVWKSVYGEEIPSRIYVDAWKKFNRER